MILYYIIVYSYMHMQETSNLQNNVFLLLHKWLQSFILFGVPQITSQPA